MSRGAPEPITHKGGSDQIDRVNEPVLQTSTKEVFVRIGSTARYPLLIVAFVATIFLAMAPLGSALAVHHVFGTVDHDGHQHSDFDLCQWVKYHASGSIQSDAPGLRSFLVSDDHLVQEPQALLSFRLTAFGQPRAPPVFSPR